MEAKDKNDAKKKAQTMLDQNEYETPGTFKVTGVSDKAKLKSPFVAKNEPKKGSKEEISQKIDQLLAQMDNEELSNNRYHSSGKYRKHKQELEKLRKELKKFKQGKENDYYRRYHQ